MIIRYHNAHYPQLHWCQLHHRHLLLALSPSFNHHQHSKRFNGCIIIFMEKSLQSIRSSPIIQNHSVTCDQQTQVNMSNLNPSQAD